MIGNDQALFMIAKARQQEFLERAEARRIARLLRASQERRPAFWQQARGWLGRLIVSAGRRLRAQRAQGGKFNEHKIYN